MKIERKDLNKILYKVIYKTYIKALVKASPGDGTTHSNWDVRIEDNKIVLFNSPTGDNIKFTNDGTKAHEIHAKPGKWLKFKAGKPKSGGQPKHKIQGNIAFESDGFIFAKAVYHPGIQAKHYIEKIMDDKALESEARTLLEKEIGDLIEKIYKIKK